MALETMLPTPPAVKTIAMKILRSAGGCYKNKTNCMNILGHLIANQDIRGISNIQFIQENSVQSTIVYYSFKIYTPQRDIEINSEKFEVFHHLSAIEQQTFKEFKQRYVTVRTLVAKMLGDDDQDNNSFNQIHQLTDTLDESFTILLNELGTSIKRKKSNVLMAAVTDITESMAHLKHVACA